MLKSEIELLITQYQATIDRLETIDPISTSNGTDFEYKYGVGWKVWYYKNGIKVHSFINYIRINPYGVFYTMSNGDRIKEEKVYGDV